MKHRIIFFDMDGTLYQTENNIIQDSSLDMIDDLRRKGYAICAATGRPFHQLSQILKQVQFDFYILINGSYILDGAFEEIYGNPIKKEYVHDMVELSRKEKLGLMFHFGDSTYIYNSFYPMYDFCKYCNVLDYLFYDPSQSYHKRHKAYDAVIMTKDQSIIENFVKEHPGLQADLINVKSDGFCYDIFNQDSSKANGIEKILEKAHLSWKDVIAFGDSTNDIEMLKMADIGVAMGTATDHVKSFANFSTTSVYDNGISNAMKKILLEEENETE
ncbi:MAG: HAD family phosphatase [Erysipelotrichaceae bacterium]|nr:HAD family phosphatase [Erysipelotrichaceae bacterium]